MSSPAHREFALCLSGDVMTGRGIDQILPHPSQPQLQEGYVKDARDYVDLAEQLNGPIPAPVDWGYIWGDALPILLTARARIINLETSITRSDKFARGKGIHYRMHPDNVACLLAAAVDCCVLANNHVMDWGVTGLEETLSVLQQAGIGTAGAGRRLEDARSPAVIVLSEERRVLVFGYGTGSSGIPAGWAAGDANPGVSFLSDLSSDMARGVAADVERFRRPGDFVIVSLHWGRNWGYEVPDRHVRFARALIDSDVVDVVHGHSSHHPIGIERYRNGLILYGCGDLLNDYEGIHGHESFRADLSLLYRVSVPHDPLDGVRLSMTPLQIRNMRLNHASERDAEWLASALTRASAGFGTRIETGENNELHV